ncbi:MAG: isoprenyl transferase [Alphaproteobacteria bacterium]
MEFSVTSVSPLPQHVAIIMDGSRRWAKNKGLSALDGHRQGVGTLKEIVKACPGLGIRYLTVYAFSSENWDRPKQEVLGLMALMQDYLKREIDELDRHGVCLRVLGERSNLSPRLQSLIQEAETRTSKNTTLGLQVAISYGGRSEIVRAIQALIKDALSQELPTDGITESLFASYLDTKGIPDPDLLIRTSGETRISNYLLWQIAYTELMFIEKYWPDFKPDDLKTALQMYMKRERRFGKAA